MVNTNFFQKTHLEYQESLQAVERALDYLNKPGSNLALYVKNWVTDVHGNEDFTQLDGTGMVGDSFLELSSRTKVAEKQQLRVSAKQHLLLKLKAFLKARGDARRAFMQEADSFSEEEGGKDEGWTHSLAGRLEVGLG